MVTLAAFILLCVCAIVLGAMASSPVRWVVVGLAVLALLLVVVGGLPLIRAS